MSVDLSRIKQRGIPREHVATLVEDARGQWSAFRGSARLCDPQDTHAEVFAELHRMNQSGMSPEITHFKRKGRNFKLPAVAGTDQKEE